MQIRPTKGLTFDDVLLIPRRSSISSRQDVNTSTRLTENIHIKIPVMSANMDTVTEARMAIAMARAGGIGILHRFMSIEAQVREVKTVKRAQGFIIEHPYNIGPDATIEQARALMDRLKIPYRWVDIDQDKDAARLVEEINHGFRSVPTILWPDGSILVEPSNEELAAKLGI